MSELGSGDVAATKNRRMNRATKKRTRHAPKTRQASVAASIRARKAVDLRLAGYTFHEIAKELGFRSRQSAAASVNLGLRNGLREAGSEELRALEVERHTKLIRKHWEAATQDLSGPDIKHAVIDATKTAAGIVLQSARALIRLQGLEAPVRVESSGPEGGPIRVKITEMDDDEVLELARRLMQQG